MKIMTSILAGATLIALTPEAALANGPDMSFAVHDITVSSNIPAVNISVRNMSPSANPAQRDLRVTSPTPVLNVSGQVWCKSFQNAHTRADAARVMFGNAALTSSNDGVDVFPIGTWSSSPVEELGPDETLRNYSIQAPVNFPDHWTGGFTLGFNPVREVEERMEQFVQNGAGTEADFMRVDDVFETTITMNAVGWCDYDGQNVQGRYAGLRPIQVPVHIFYHGDPDIEDEVAAVGTANTVHAPTPGREPTISRRQSRRETAPRVREPARDRAGRAGVSIAVGDINNDEATALLVPAVQRNHETAPADEDAPRCAPIVDTIRREAARAAIGLLLGSNRSGRGTGRSSDRDRIVNDTVDRVAGC